MQKVWKVVMTLALHDDRHKQKAINLVSGLHGIDQISVDMNDQKMTVIGTVEPVDLVTKLRHKLFPTAQIVSVGPPSHLSPTPQMQKVWKVVMKLGLHDDRHKQKALNLVSGLHGINQISVDMNDQKMTVIGTVDPVDLVGKLRHKFFPTAQIVSVGPPMEEKKDSVGPSKEEKKDDKKVDIQSASSVLEHIMLDGSVEPTNVPLALLQHITKDFAAKRQIGRGGFGVVYKGDLQNGSVAVKRLLNSHTIDEMLFYREATSMISVKHENIVRLLGYCANTEGRAMINPDPGEKIQYIFAEIRERLLCFEYIKNGSLNNYLADELTGLEWHTRYKIIKGICNGLDYLHNEKGIIHKDLKPANILVDDLMVPKITDFGISKFLDGATHAVTSNGAMTFGYSAPEFIHRGVVSCKSDVYSLGVIIMELVTGHKGDPDIKNVLRRWRHRWNKSVKYPPSGYQQVTKCIEIALRCLSDSSYKRPHVREILSTLNATECRDVQINCADESPVCPISPYPWELLEFDKLELNFPFEINKEIPCSLELSNATDDYVAFHIQKTGILEYSIEPNKGVVPPRSKCIIIVTLQARVAAPYDVMCKDEFVMRCTAVNEGIIAQDFHEDMFNNESGKLVDEVMLTVVI